MLPLAADMIERALVPEAMSLLRPADVQVSFTASATQGQRSAALPWSQVQGLEDTLPDGRMRCDVWGVRVAVGQPLHVIVDMVNQVCRVITGALLLIWLPLACLSAGQEAAIELQSVCRDKRQKRRKCRLHAAA